MNWYLTNVATVNNTPVDTNIPFITAEKEGIKIFIDGYILPRLTVDAAYKNLSNIELVTNLYNKYQIEFINYIKGAFNLILLINGKYYIFNDKQSLEKYFVFRDKNYFIISNSLRFITCRVKLKYSKENAALFCLTEHFVDGLTMYEEVSYSKPATIAKYDGELSISNYWTPMQLLNRKNERLSPEYLAEIWKEVINGYVEYLKPKEISMTLTGGNDSRMVLAGLLSNNIHTRALTFGNPKSHDCVVASRVAENLGIEHKIYYTDSASKDWFEKQTKKITDIGNSLINIHRAHRYEAIEKEKENHPNTEMLFMGLVGGEYLKEPDFDNITIPSLYNELYFLKEDKDKMECISKQLVDKGIDSSKIDLKNLLNKLNRIILTDSGLSGLQRKFIHTYYYYGSVHHTQDPSLFQSQIKYVVNPFMDIDFLETITSSEYWYPNRRKHLFDKLWHSYILIKITDLLDKRLSAIVYAKKGEYTGDEILRKPAVYVIKRAWKYLYKNKKYYPQNFPLSKWLYEYALEQLAELHPKIKELYMDRYLEKNLLNCRNYTTEENWHKITNPINLSLNMNYYEKD